MGALTETDFQSELVYMLDGRDDIVAARRLRWLNQTLLHVAMPSIYRHRELELTDSFALATDDIDYSITEATLGRKLWVLYDVFYIAGTSLTDVTLRRERLQSVGMRKMDLITTRATGEPNKYALWGETLFTDTRPTASENGNLIALRGYWSPTLMTSGGGSHELRAEWDEVILYGAQWRAWKALGLVERAELAKEDFASMMNEITNQRRLDAEDPGRTVAFAQPDYIGGR